MFSSKNRLRVYFEEGFLWAEEKPLCYFLPQKVAKTSKRANQGRRTCHPRAPVEAVLLLLRASLRL